MKYPILSLLLLLTFSFGAFAQENPPVEQPNKPVDIRAEALRQLNLTPEQIAEIKKVHQERKQIMAKALFAQREAREKLDIAIYADTFDQQTVDTAVNNMKRAEANLAEQRSVTEIAIRKILTSEQLVRFRELRDQFARRLRERGNQREMMPRRPANNLRKTLPKTN